MIPFQGLLVNRAVNYAVVPFVAKTGRAIEDWWTNMDSGTRNKLYTAGFCVLWPLLSLIDGLRYLLVKLYVIDGAAANAVWAHSRALNSIVFQNKLPAVTSWKGQKKTRSFAFPVVLLLTPLFYVADMSRSVAADKIHPLKHDEVEQHCEEMWQNTFASTLKQR